MKLGPWRAVVQLLVVALTVVFVNALLQENVFNLSKI